MKKYILSIILFALVPIAPAHASNPPCLKSQVNKVKNKLICTQVTKFRYAWLDPQKVNTLKFSPKPSASPSPTSSATTKPANPADNLSLISQSSIDIVNKKIKNDKIEKLNTNYIIADTIDKKHINRLYEELDFAYSYWNDIYDGKDLNIILWDYESSAWANKIYDDIKGNWNRNFTLSSGTTSASSCMNATQSNFSTGNKPKYVITSCENPIFFNTLKFKMSHEYTHVVQDQLGLIKPYSPIWLIEGSAHYYGQVLGFRGNLDSISNNRKDLLFGLAHHSNNKWSYNFNNISKSDFIFHMKKLESRFHDKENTISAYLLGSIATEYLIGLYGEDRLLAFWKTYQNSSNTPANFSLVYGTSIDSFYNNLYEYYVFTLKNLKN